MESLGKYLLDLRIQRDISYSRIAKDILIREELIHFMEQNRFFDLGDYGVAKALVYNYARYLEADLDAVMKEFRIMMPENTKGKFHPRTNVKEKKIMLSTNFLWMVGILIFVAILSSILVYSGRQGWLKAPEFFSSKPKAAKEIVDSEPKEESKPDSLRIRMRALSEAIPADNSTSVSVSAGTSVPPDTTDYIGNILGSSPVNVPLH